MKLLNVKRRRSTALVLSQVLRGAAVLAVPAATLLLAAPAEAQGTGVLTGTVRDAASKAPLADVVVTVTSPQLQGEQTVVTDSSGSYRIPALPPGSYTLHLDKEGFKPGGRGGITLRVDSTIRVNMEILPENLKGEEIVVVGKAPVIDVGSSSTGVNVNSDFTSRIPLNRPNGRNAASRSFEDMAEVAPGAQADGYGVSISGTTSPENSYLIDGLSVNDPAFGILATPLSIEFVDQMTVITGGYMPEYGKSTGGILDVVTKSGSNEFHGSAFFSITPGALEGNRATVKSSGSAVTWQPRLSSLRDYGAEVGGPIVKDKLWFFAGVDFAFTRQRLNKTLSELSLDKFGHQVIDPKTGFAESKSIPNSTTTYYADATAVQVFTKLTYNINQDHHLSVSFAANPSSSGGNGGYGISNQLQTPEVAGDTAGAYGALAHIYIADAYDTSLKYAGSWDNKRWLLDATLGWHHQHSGTRPADDSTIGSTDPKTFAGQPSVYYRQTTPDFHSISDFEHVPAGACQPKQAAGNFSPRGAPVAVPKTPCGVDTYYSGGSGFLDDENLNRYQGKAILTRLIQFAGHHVIKGGVDVELMEFDHTKAYSGGDFYREGTAGSYFSDYRQYGVITSPDKTTQFTTFSEKSKSTAVGGFLQDSWSIMDKVTINVGLRYDAQFLVGDDGTSGLKLPNQWSPRVGFVYDFTHEGKSKIFGNFARFYEGVPLDVVDRSFPSEPQATAYHANAPGCTNPALGNQGGSKGTCQVGDGNRIPGFGNLPFDPNQKFHPTGGDPEPVDPNLHAQSSDEWVVGGEYQILEDGTLGVVYTHRYQNYVVEDMSRDEANTYFIGNPGYGIAKDFPKATRDYDAVSIYFTKAFSHSWLAQASYTVAALRGNWAGLFRPETLQLDPNINSDFDLRSLLPNRTGPLPGDTTHAFKIYGAKDFQLPANMILQIGGSFNGASGAPTNYLGSHILYGPNEVYVLPRGSGDRLPWVFHVDTHVGVGYRINKDSTLLVGMDIFNLFGFQQVTQTDETFTNSDVLPLAGGTKADVAGCKGPTAKGNCKLINPDSGTPFAKGDYNPNFGNATQYQSPREWRFTGKITF